MCVCVCMYAKYKQIRVNRQWEESEDPAGLLYSLLCVLHLCYVKQQYIYQQAVISSHSH